MPLYVIDGDSLRLTVFHSALVLGDMLTVATYFDTDRPTRRELRVRAARDRWILFVRYGTNSARDSIDP